VCTIHHIGSTAILGLKAKLIIDIAIELDNFGVGFECVKALSLLGYRHRSIPELPDRHYWRKGEPRTHQIHMYAKGSKYFYEQFIFEIS